MASEGAWEEAYGEPIDRIDALAIHARIRSVLASVCERFEREGIRTLVVKGALLAHQLYDSPADRPLRDIDLRIRAADLSKARALLSAMGGREIRRSIVYQDAIHCIDRVDIDLEAHLGPPFFSALSIDALLARASRRIEPLGFFHWAPEVHDHALLLLVNVFKDHVGRVASWSFDDLQRIVRQPSFDADLLVARAKEAELTTVAHVVARYLATFRADPIWNDIATCLPAARPMYAMRILQASQKSEKESLVERVMVRACADDPKRAIAGVAVGALREAESWVNVLRLRATR